MTQRSIASDPRLIVALLLTSPLLFVSWSSNGQEDTRPAATADSANEDRVFRESVQPVIQKYCVRCHNVDNMKSGVRVDQLTAIPTDRQLFLWKAIGKQIGDGAMPPEDEPRPTDAEQQVLSDWISGTLTAALKRNTQRNGSVRRLTVSQYRNTLRDLLGLEEDLTEVLPPDGISKDGFANNGQTMVLSPLQVETYFDIAEKTLDLCIVDEAAKPLIQNFRMELGEKINTAPCPDKLVLGANSFLLNNDDFTVTQLTPEKPFDYEPFFMQTKFNFIEGYVGNDTIREWRKFDSIYHAVFACLRGSPGYPKGEAYQVAAGGLLLRPAIPSSEIFGVSNTYGPMANFKISLRELPDRGNFRVTIKAARYDDALLLDPAAAPNDDPAAGAIIEIADLKAMPQSTVAIPQPGVYRVDIGREPGTAAQQLSLTIAEKSFRISLPEARKATADGDAAPAGQRTSVAIMRLPGGPHKLQVQYGDNTGLTRIVLTPIDRDTRGGRQFAAFERQSPSLGVYVGLRRDCGSTLTRVGEPVPVAAGELKDYVFSGPINDFPSPDVEKDNVNYLAGIREIGVRSEYTDGRDTPRLLIRSIEFEGPYYDEWPPAPHRRIFVESPNKDQPEVYAREILAAFATRAFRRPATATEVDSLVAIWRESYRADGSFSQSVKDALLTVLTSPQFLFLIERSSSPDAEDLDGSELAAKLSYFLWNTAPDTALIEWAQQDQSRQRLDAEVERLIADRRCDQFLQEFGAQWFGLDKFDVLAVDMKRFPKLTRDAKIQLRQEPIEFLKVLIRDNLPLRNLIQSDFVVANEVVASYYGLGERTNSGFQFVPIKHENVQLGGVLTQAGILAGLSDGREPNPVKRGAWVARKIVAEPPDDPPPNVPKLPEDDGQHLTLRQKLERHRNQEGCAKCHSGIDPWGLPFEQYDAAGLFRRDAVDAASRLPDGTEVQDLNSLRSYLADDRIDQVAFSFLKHLATYAVGRSLTYNELVFLQTEGITLRESGYRMREMIQFVTRSQLFLTK